MAVKVTMNSAGSRELLHAPEVRAVLRREAQKVAARAAVPTEVVEDTTDRARAAVVAKGDPRATRMKEARDGDLQRALGSA